MLMGPRKDLQKIFKRILGDHGTTISSASLPVNIKLDEMTTLLLKQIYQTPQDAHIQEAFFFFLERLSFREETYKNCGQEMPLFLADTKFTLQHQIQEIWQHKPEH